MTSKTCMRIPRSLRTIVLLCIILSSPIVRPPAASAGFRLVGTEEWSLFVNADDHYSLKYPSWASVKRPFAQNATIDLAENGTITILAEPNPGERSVGDWIDMLNSGLDEPWLVGPRPFQTSTWEGVLVDARVDPTKAMQAVFVVAEGRIYKIAFPALKEPFGEQSQEVLEVVHSLRFGGYSVSTMPVDPPEGPSPDAVQCPGAPFVLPTSGNLWTRWHEYLSPGACNDCNPGCDHTGIDVGADLNTPVYAAYSGTAYYVGTCAIRIIHTIDSSWAGTVPDLTVQTYYTHLNWRRGEGWAEKGEIIGGQGTCGNVNTHLHFSIAEQWANELCIGNTRDPSSYLGAQVNDHNNPQPKWVPVQCGGGCCGCGKLKTAGKQSPSFAPESFRSPSLASCISVSASTAIQPGVAVPLLEPVATAKPAAALVPAAIPNPTATPLPVAMDEPPAPSSIPIRREAVEAQRTPPASESYRIPKSVFGSGGGEKASASFVMNSTQGQGTDLSRRQSASYTLAPGYWGQWAPLVYDYAVYLSLVVKNH